MSGSQLLTYKGSGVVVISLPQHFMWGIQRESIYCSEWQSGLGYRINASNLVLQGFILVKICKLQTIGDT
jgi:hypothetical protein